MVKPMQNNAFTLIESLIVLLIVVILGLIFSVTKIKTVSLPIFFKQIQSRTLAMQEKAYANKEQEDIQFGPSFLYINGEVIEYPKGITCEPFSFHYNENGNISVAGTLRCSSQNQSGKLVFLLGSGRVYASFD